MATLLVVGEDWTLLEIRAAVLRTTGAETVCSRSTSALDILADRHFDLVVLCHSVPALPCSTLVRVIRGRWPQTRILLLSRHEEVDVDPAMDAISSTDPESLVRNTRQQLKLIEQAADHSKLQVLPALPAKQTPAIGG